MNFPYYSQIKNGRRPRGRGHVLRFSSRSILRPGLFVFRVLLPRFGTGAKPPVMRWRPRRSRTGPLYNFGIHAKGTCSSLNKTHFKVSQGVEYYQQIPPAPARGDPEKRAFICVKRRPTAAPAGASARAGLEPRVRRRPVSGAL